MRLLITGASGYIGTSVIRFLKDKVEHLGVICRSERSINIVNDILDGSEFTAYQADLIENISELPVEKYDFLIHLAAANDIESKDITSALLGTVLSTKNILELCKSKGIKNVIYFSTFQVIGNVDGELDEDTVVPKNDYAITHKFSEDYVEMYNRMSGLDYLIMRPTNIYGAPIHKDIERWSLVPNCFCKEVFENQKITLLSSGKQSRDFLNLLDLGPLLLKTVEAFGELKNKTVNVSSGNKFTIVEIAEIVKSIYEERYKTKCKIEVRSEHPKEENEFNISRKEIQKFNYTFSDKNSITNEINKIFNLLEKS